MAFGICDSMKRMNGFDASDLAKTYKFHPHKISLVFRRHSMQRHPADCMVPRFVVSFPKCRPTIIRIRSMYQSNSSMVVALTATAVACASLLSPSTVSTSVILILMCVLSDSPLCFQDCSTSVSGFACFVGLGMQGDCRNPHQPPRTVRSAAAGSRHPSGSRHRFIKLPGLCGNRP